VPRAYEEKGAYERPKMREMGLKIKMKLKDPIKYQKVPRAYKSLNLLLYRKHDKEYPNVEHQLLMTKTSPSTNFPTLAARVERREFFLGSFASTPIYNKH
jgi:hypothetical protein